MSKRFVKKMPVLGTDWPSSDTTDVGDSMIPSSSVRVSSQSHHHTQHQPFSSDPARIDAKYRFTSWK